jgi:hypothetical protein
MRRSIATTVAMVLATGLSASVAGAADIGIVGLKLIILDKNAAASKAKVVFVAKDPGIDKGTGDDASDISAQMDVSGTTGAGVLLMPQGSNWLVNKDTVAKYVNKQAPTGGSVKVSVLKPTKLVKVVGKSLGDTPVDISAPPAGDVSVIYTVNNGATTNRFCTRFTGCVHKVIAGGGNYKLICKGNAVADPTCSAPSSPSGAFLD